MHKQLTLNLALDDTYTFDNFWPIANEATLKALKHYLQHQLPTLIFLFGEKSSGKTHVLRACGEALKKNQQTVITLAMQDLITLSPNILDGLEHLDCIIIDDIDAIAGHTAWQEAFFHCYNRCLDTGCHWIVSATHAPQFLPLDLKDLTSRLSQGVTWALNPLSDQDKSAALIHRAKSTGLDLPVAVADYLIHHYARDMASQVHRLTQLEQASLAQGRKLTIPFIKTILNTKDDPYVTR